MASSFGDERLLSSDEIDALIVEEVENEDDRTMDEVISDAGTAEGKFTGG